MTEPRFTPRLPIVRPASSGFEVGVLRIAWLEGDDPFVVGLAVVTAVAVGDRVMRRAIVMNCWTDSGVLSRDALIASLHGVVVVDPTGVLCTIRGVDSPATTTLYVGVEIGILLSAAAEAR